MVKIKIKLEYRCFPVWLYDGNDNFIDNELPSKLIGDVEVDPVFVSVQEEFDSLYKNDGVEFKYVGFKHSASKKEFCRKLNNAIKLLREKVSTEYIIENCINMDDL